MKTLMPFLKNNIESWKAGSTVESVTGFPQQSLIKMINKDDRQTLIKMIGTVLSKVTA